MGWASENGHGVHLLPNSSLQAWALLILPCPLAKAGECLQWQPSPTTGLKPAQKQTRTPPALLLKIWGRHNQDIFLLPF